MHWAQSNGSQNGSGAAISLAVVAPPVSDVITVVIQKPISSISSTRQLGQELTVSYSVLYLVTSCHLSLL